MPKIKIPKSSPSIDMTPMVDLAFLLVTFFMLSAKTRVADIVEVDTPFSVEDNDFPENYVVVTIDKNGRKFFSMNSRSLKESVLADLSKKYNFSLTKKQLDEYYKITSIGCDIRVLPQFLSAKDEERNKYIGIGIPTDSTDNQLKNWISACQKINDDLAETTFLEDINKNPNLDKTVNDYEIKYIIKADNEAVYFHAKDVIESFRDLEELNLNFVTSLQMKGEK